jgi:uncharacterized protein YcgI (DUF1989 family)
VIPKVGDGLYDNERRKMLTIVEDTTDGVHDTLIAACDKERYLELGGEEGHRHCAGNMVEGLGALGDLSSVLYCLLIFLSFGEEISLLWCGKSYRVVL